MTTYFLIALGVVWCWCEDKIKSQSKNLRDCRGVSSDRGKGKEKKPPKPKQINKKTSLYLWYRKVLKENAPQRMAAKRRKKAHTCTVFINIYDYVGLFLAHNSW